MRNRGGGQREKQAPCRRPVVGLDPGCPGSCPGPKAALNNGATRAAPKFLLKTLFPVWSL